MSGGLSFSSGASLLHPLASWTSETHLMGWKTEFVIGQPAYLTAVAAVNGTTVAVTPSMATAAGLGLLPGQPDVEMKVTIDEGDVVQLVAKPDEIDPLQGLTGSLVRSGSEHKVGVFSGHACAGLPQVVDNMCGHMQEQISMQLAGEDFAVSHLLVRDEDAPEPTLFQIYALTDGTMIEFEPGEGTEGLPIEGITLDAGESYVTWVGGDSAEDGDFVLHAEHPVMVSAYMGNPPPNDVGSPSMVQLAPVGRHLADYSLFVPEDWKESVALIARPAESVVKLDGIVVPDEAFHPVGEFEFAQVPLDAGLHELTGSEPFSAVVNGVRERDGYAYLGGWATPMPAFPPPK